MGGLVEVPCQNRNAIGVAAAFSSAQLALAGIKSLVPFDQMAHVMLSVGHALPATLRETAKGGIAQAPPRFLPAPNAAYADRQTSPN